MTNIKTSEQTVKEILGSYGIQVGTTPDSMPQISLTPRVVIQYQGGSGESSDPLIVYAASSDMQYAFLLGSIKDKTTGLPAYLVMSASKPDASTNPYLSSLGFIGGGVAKAFDVVITYVGTGLATGTFDESALRALSDALKDNVPKCPLEFPSNWIKQNKEETVWKEFKKTPGFGFVCVPAIGIIGIPGFAGNEGESSVPAWADLDVALSKVFLRRLGITYQTIGSSFQFVLWLDGFYSLGGKPDDKGKVEGDGIILDLVGWHIGIKINDDYSWHLAGGYPDGLGLNYVKDPVQIGGGFAIIRDRGEYEFLAEGGLAFSIPGLNFEILGAYARAKSGQDHADYPLVFFYLLMQLTSTTKGAPPNGIEVFPGVMLTGLCFGGGMNNQLHVPDPAKVLKFPLVTPLMAGGQTPNSPLDVLDKLTMPDADLHLTWITPQDGGFWFTAGLAANIVEVFNIWGLVVVSIPKGGNWGAALIGILDMVSFKGLFKVKAAVEAEVSAELVAIGATLAPGSYLFSSGFLSASGGIDLYTYIGGTNRGTWVLTAGGYPGGFATPSSYPGAPPRIGVSHSLKVGPFKCELAIGGFVMISNVGMAAGGDMEIGFTGKKWGCEIVLYVAITLDFRVQWSPFYAEIAAGVKAGIKIKVAFVKVKFEVSLDASIWLPPFGGEVSVKLPFGLHFSIPFGDSAEDPKWLKWDEFVDQMLPTDAHLLVKAESGLLPNPSTPDAAAQTLAVKDDSSAKVWNVSIHGFSFSTHSVVPSTDITVNSNKLSNLQAWPLHVRPMGPPEESHVFTSNHVVSVKYGGVKGHEFDLVAENWKVEPIADKAPEAMWGAPLENNQKPKLEAEGLVDAYTGVRITVPDAQMGPHIPTINTEDLGPEPVDPDSDMPISPSATTPSDQPLPASDPNAITTIANTITAAGASKRSLLDTALRNSQTQTAGTQDYSPHTDGTLSGFQTRITHGLYTKNPLTV